MADKINEFLKSHKRSVLLGCVLALALVLIINTIITGGILNAGEDEKTALAASNINPRYNELMKNGAKVLSSDNTVNTISTSSPSIPGTTAKQTPSSTAAPATTEPTTLSPDSDVTVPFATAIPPAYPADYQSQWEMGYLIAIDNPDPTYACSYISLTEDDRDLLERLCMGEFGSGGFIGAALIAQCVKDAMCFDGYSNVADVIKYCRYDGSTSIGTNDACRQAVRYIFDDNRDAVQHRIMYMYNPYMVSSGFHESQNFILSYQSVRFFDRWGY